MGWEPREEDLEIVQESLERMAVLEYTERSINELSGGQRQRVFIARALAQRPRFFMFDEPTSSLDLRYQLETMKVMSDIVHGSDSGLIIAVHDLNLALHYSDFVYLVRDGKLAYGGAPEEVITSEVIEEVYAVKSIMADTEEGRFILPFQSKGGELRPGQRHVYRK